MCYIIFHDLLSELFSNILFTIRSSEISYTVTFLRS
uniref:Uncharacterized protein n=1 Tax=Arundo donax TaxID=35708 RepID=A0A0A9BA18_ARUDO